MRKVEYWLDSIDNEKKIGMFHAWGQRNDGYVSEFFGVVENEVGDCLELDPCQIRFTEKEVIA